MACDDDITINIIPIIIVVIIIMTAVRLGLQLQ